MKKSFVFLILFSTLAAHAAPHPATSSSLLTDPQEGHYFESQGFRLKTAGTDWLPTPQNSDSIFESVRMTPKGQIEATSSFSVRTDTLSKQSTLEAYAKKWMRDYPSYGFEVLGAKSFSMAGGPGLVVDMVQKNKGKQIRQVILQKGQRVAILTCLDNQAQFQKTLTSCNQLVKNFEWNSSDGKPSAKPATAATVSSAKSFVPKPLVKADAVPSVRAKAEARAENKAAGNNNSRKVQ